MSGNMIMTSEEAREAIRNEGRAAAYAEIVAMLREHAKMLSYDAEMTPPEHGWTYVRAEVVILADLIEARAKEQSHD